MAPQNNSVISQSSRLSDTFGNNFHRCYRFIKRAFGRTAVCVLTAWLASTILALLLTATIGIPAPKIHDEFAYLLGADTLASGRVTNPTHPMWQHFESFHIIHQPSYICKYPPAQAMTLAIGQRMGHPIIGVCLATGVATGALVWMLLGWLPKRYGLVVTLFAIFHPGIQILWGQSYWGGAVALCGASLLLGAFARLSSKMKVTHGLIAAIGIVILANSRPMEGAILTLTVLAVLIWKLIRMPAWNPSRFALRVALPAVPVLGLAAFAMYSYNVAVTEDGLKMPYQVHESLYGWNPVFVWQQAGEKPEYRHPIMQSFFEMDKHNNELKFQSFVDVVRVKIEVAFKFVSFFCGSVAVLGILGLPLLRNNKRYRYVFLLLLPAFFASLLSYWGWPHYCAPAAPMVMLVALASVFELWRRCSDRPALRRVILYLLPALHIIWWTTTLVVFANAQQRSWARHRVAMKQQLLESEGRDLVLVRYSEEHDTNNEWVYNDADIDRSGVVWAREISDARRSKLLQYFSDRKVWVLEADAESPRLKPFVDELDKVQLRNESHETN